MSVAVARTREGGNTRPRSAAAPPDRTRIVKAVVVAADALAIAVFLFSYGSHGLSFGAYHIDLEVYRIGARAWLDGQDLYGVLPATGHGQMLPFTYPPLAAVVATPAAVLPVAVDGIGLTLVSAVLLAWVLYVFLRGLDLPEDISVGWLAAGALPVALLLDPVRVAFVDGQIDILLMAMIVYDTLGPGLRFGPFRARGALIGLAAALKLTPAAYILFFLARRKYRAAGVTAVSFALFTVLGYLAAPGNSTDYWTRVLFQTGRIGPAAYASNQSIRGALARLGMTGIPLDLAWVALSALIVSAAFYVMRRLRGRGDAARALLVTAAAELLISPISWTHHWVWAAPALLLLAGRSLHVSPRLFAAALAGFALFVVGPQWLLPHGADRELSWAVWQQVLGNGYVWSALALLLIPVAVSVPAGRLVT